MQDECQLWRADNIAMSKMISAWQCAEFVKRNERPLSKFTPTWLHVYQYVIIY